MSRPRKFFSATAIVIWIAFSSLIGFASSARAGVIAQHLGAADPTAEGWVKIDQSNGAHIFAPVFNDLGTTDAWNIDTTNQGGDGKYRFYLNSTQLNEALLNGWSLHARVRLIDVAPAFGHSVFLRTGTQAFQLNFGTDSYGDPVITYGGPPDYAAVTISGGAGLYHDYELRDADADGSADLIIDGTLAATNIFVYPDGGFATAVVFGDYLQSASLSGNAYYALVVFESIPEPSAGLLIVVGAGWLALCHTRRRHIATPGDLR